MGTRYRQIYMESVISGRPTLWAAPPAGVIATDISETVVHSVLSFGGTWMLAGGIQYVMAGNSGSIDMMSCAAWGGVAAGIVMLAPIAGDVAADFLSDIRQGWERGATQERDTEQDISTQVAELPSDETMGAARVPGAWWYHDIRGNLKCYHTPVAPAKGTESPKPIISDQRMVAIFSEVARGTPFSERKMCEKLSGLSGPQFRKLQDDWTHPTRQLYVIRPNRSGYFTRHGQLIVDAIRTTQL